METWDRAATGRGAPVADSSETPEIRAYSTSEDRTVFTESGNGDGWIATTLTVEPEA